jgi:hypothetical protein
MELHGQIFAKEKVPKSLLLKHARTDQKIGKTIKLKKT